MRLIRAIAYLTGKGYRPEFDDLENGTIWLEELWSDDDGIQTPFLNFGPKYKTPSLGDLVKAWETIQTFIDKGWKAKTVGGRYYFEERLHPRVRYVWNALTGVFDEEGINYPNEFLHLRLSGDQAHRWHYLLVALNPISNDRVFWRIVWGSMGNEGLCFFTRITDLLTQEEIDGIKASLDSIAKENDFNLTYL